MYARAAALCREQMLRSALPEGRRSRRVFAKGRYRRRLALLIITARSAIQFSPILAVKRDTLHAPRRLSATFNGAAFQTASRQLRQAASVKVPFRSSISVCYALTAPEVMPSMYRRELNENMTTSGTVAITKPAIMAP